MLVVVVLLMSLLPLMVIVTLNLLVSLMFGVLYCVGAGGTGGIVAHNNEINNSSNNNNGNRNGNCQQYNQQRQ